MTISSQARGSEIFATGPVLSLKDREAATNRLRRMGYDCTVSSTADENGVYVILDPKCIDLATAKGLLAKVFPPDFPIDVYEKWKVNFGFGKNLNSAQMGFVCAALRQHALGIRDIGKGRTEITVGFDECPTANTIEKAKAIIAWFV